MCVPSLQSAGRARAAVPTRYLTATSFGVAVDMRRQPSKSLAESQGSAESRLC